MRVSKSSSSATVITILALFFAFLAIILIFTPKAHSQEQEAATQSVQAKLREAVAQADAQLTAAEHAAEDFNLQASLQAGAQPTPDATKRKLAALYKKFQDAETALKLQMVEVSALQHSLALATDAARQQEARANHLVELSQGPKDLLEIPPYYDEDDKTPKCMVDGYIIHWKIERRDTCHGSYRASLNYTQYHNNSITGSDDNKIHDTSYYTVESAGTEDRPTDCRPDAVQVPVCVKQ